jgi:WG containing repeat
MPRRLCFLVLLAALLSPALCAQASAPRRLFQVEQDGKWGFIDSSGKLVIPFKFSKTESFAEGLAAVQYRGKWGYIDESGAFSIASQFSDAGKFNDGYAAVEVDGLWGFIDRSGRFTIAPQFDRILCFVDSPPAVTNDGWEYWQYLNETRTALSDVVTNVPWGFSEGLTPVELDGKEGYVDLHGHFVIPPQFEEANVFSESLAAAKIDDKWDGKWGVIDRSGQWVIRPQFDWVTGFSEGLAVAQVGHKNGIIRKDGSWVLKPSYPFLHSMSESRAAFSGGASGKWGYLDETGKVVIEPQFDKAGDFESGLAQVEVQGRFGYIDRDGQYVWNPSK